MKKWDPSMFRSWRRALTAAATRSERQKAKAECRRWPAANQAEEERQFHEDWDREYQLQLELEWGEGEDFDAIDRELTREYFAQFGTPG